MVRWLVCIRIVRKLAGILSEARNSDESRDSLSAHSKDRNFDDSYVNSFSPIRKKGMGKLPEQLEWFKRLERSPGAKKPEI